MNKIKIKCSYCGKTATKQTEKGKYAEKAGHRKQNYGYFCEKCFNEGRKLEEEVMYGY